LIEETRIRFIGKVEHASEELCEIRVSNEFCGGLKGLSTFSHIIVLYWFHKRDDEVNRRTLRVTPRKHPGAPEVGVFASRSPSRPNSIGLCVAEVLKIEDCLLAVKGLDAFEGSPVIDIKPYLPRADSVPNAIVPEWTLRGPKT